MKKVFKRTEYDLNGFSNWQMAEIEKRVYRDLTMTFACIPYTYESCESCLFSAWDAEEKSGIQVGIGKQGKVNVRLGFGYGIVEIESVSAHLVFQKRNLLTVVFWGTTGWGHLYINGELAGIKQFRRNSELHISSGTMYIGKNNLIKDRWMARRGMFHGVLEFLAMEEHFRNFSEVKQLHAFWREDETKPIDLYRNLDFSGDIYRPAFHLIPPGKWMNEPHAPFEYHGQYHIFYQANPHAPIWDNLCWGHLVSKDMVNWSDAGIALYPDTPGLDIDGIWSGSACLDPDGNPLLFYTAGNHQKIPNQSVALAVPADLKERELPHWKKCGVKIEQQETQGFLGEFRDPFVWRMENTYYILVGTGDPDNGGGNALLYTSVDLKEFTCQGFVIDYDFEKNKEGGHVWELPVLLPLRDEQGKHVCDILMFCACQIENDIVETYYFLGEFDPNQKKFRKYHEKARLFDLGRGTFTGPSGFVTEDGRSIVFTIAQGKRKPTEEYESGWAHNGGMPIQLSIKNGRLVIEPILEIYSYFNDTVCQIRPEEESTVIGKNLLQNHISIKSRGKWISLLIEGEKDCWEIGYDRDSKEWKAVSVTSGKQISKLRGEVDLVEIDEEQIELECFVDHSLIELYLNRKKGMTLRNYDFCEKNEYRVKADPEASLTIALSSFNDGSLL